jgi:tRNA A-37 threonylcarbamoyl transferase component Bud32
MARVAGEGWSVLIYAFIEPATSLADAWSRGDASRRERLLEQLLEMTAHQHRSGLRQNDPHLDNFLLDAGERLMAIDAGGYEISSRPLGWKRSVDNLGLLFAQIPRPCLESRPGVLDAYARIRGGWDSGRLWAATLRSAHRWRAWRARRLGRKCFRNCTEFRVRRVGSLRLVHRRELEEECLDQWLAAGGLEPAASDRLLKAGNSQTVWLTRLGHRAVVVKRYNRTGRLQVLRRSLAGSRAARAWRAAHWLRSFHMDTPTPLALVEEYRGLFRQRAWLITEVAHGVPAHRAFEKGIDEQRCRLLAGVVRSFAAAGLVHGDMKASNFIVDGERVQMIDLDSVRWPRFPWRLAVGRRSDLQRFLRNWPEGKLRQCFSELLRRTPLR